MFQNKFPNALAVLGVFALVVSLLLPLAAGRYLDPDELAHLEFAFLIHDGMVPYRDFFEHHAPLLHLLTAPVFYLSSAVTNPDAAALLPLVLRGAMIVLALLHIPLMLALMRDLRQSTQIIVLLLLPATGLFIEKGIEFRPDPMAGLALGLAVLGLLRRDLAGWLLAGLMVGIAFCVTPKSMLAWPGLGLAAVVSALGTPRRMAMAAMAGAVGAALPVACMTLYLCRQDALTPFLDQVIFANSGWPVRAKLDQKLIETARYIPVILAGIGLSLAAIIMQAVKDKNFSRKALIRVLPGLGILASIVPMPLLSQQYFYWPLPLLVLATAPGLDWLASRRRLVMPALATGLIVCALWPGRHPLSIDLPMAQDVIPNSRTLTLAGQQAELRAIITQTKPDDTVWAGWWTILPYRRPALFWFFMHGEIRRLMTADNLSGIAADLQSGKAAPKLISYDRALQRLAAQQLPMLAAFIKTHYQPLGVGDLWVRR